MPLTRGQKTLLHVAPAALGVDEPTRKLVQRSLGGMESAADMEYRGYLKVMAHWEAAGWRHPRLPRDHFRRMAASDPRYRLRGKAMGLAKKLGWTNDRGLCDKQRLDAFVLRQTGGRIARLQACETEDLIKVVEGLKAMLDRPDDAGQALSHGGGRSAVSTLPRTGVAGGLQPPRRRRRKAEEADDAEQPQEPPIA